MRKNSRKPTDKQRKKLLKMIEYAFLEIRIRGFEGKAQQTSDLADAFHNLPIHIETDNFSFELFRRDLTTYRQKYPNGESFDYLEMLDKVIDEEDLN